MNRTLSTQLNAANPDVKKTGTYYSFMLDIIEVLEKYQADIKNDIA
jgi:hypothetical protein